MTDWLQVITVLLGIVTTIVQRSERRVISALRSAGATSDTQAITRPAMSRLGRWQFRRLLRHGAVVEVGDHHYCLDSSAYRSYRSARRRRGVVVALLLGATILIAWYTSK